MNETLACVLDRIVPARPDGALPGAGALGLGEALGERLGDAVLAGALVALDDLAREAGLDGFAAAEASRQTALLNALEARQPGLLPGLVFHTYTLYYQHPRVLETLGVPPRPPWPEGYDVEQGDLGGLDAVRARGRIWREV